MERREADIPEDDTMTSIERMTELDGGIGPNAMLIRTHATRVINGQIPRRVRSELMAAV